MGPDLHHRVNQHADILRRLGRTLTNIEQRIAFLETKIDHIEQHTSNGNGTRNLILAAIVVKILFEGIASIDVTSLTHLIKAFGG